MESQGVDAPAASLFRKIDTSPAKWLWLPSERTLPNTFVLFRRELALSNLGERTCRQFDGSTSAAPALDLMAENYAHETEVGLLARQCHLSVTHFRRIFQKALAKSPQLYLTELRIQMAASRIQATNEKVIDIAHATGFTTLSSFNRSFRRVMNVTPRQWRSLR